MVRIKVIALVSVLALLLLVPTLLGILLLRQPEVLSEASDTRPEEELSRIDYMDNGRPVKVDNGEFFEISDDLRLAVTVNPYPPVNFEPEVDFYLTTAEGEPVVGAEITAPYDMLYMFHGWSRSRLTDEQDGHYRFKMDLFMFGPWTIDTLIKTEEYGRVSIPITIYVWPA